MPRPSIGRFRRIVASGAALCSLLLVRCGFGEVGDGFECGTPISPGSSTFRTCSGTEQICVCRTTSCAQLVPTSDCPTGYRYIDSPFARANLANTCVSSFDIVGATDLGAAAQVCVAVDAASPSVDAANSVEASLLDGANGETGLADGASVDGANSEDASLLDAAGGETGSSDDGSHE